MRATTLYDVTTCGVSVWDDFDNPHWLDDDDSYRFGGIDFAIAGFIDTSECKKVYKDIKRKYTIVYQSPVKTNRNSGNQFFFVVFSKDKK